MNILIAPNAFKRSVSAEQAALSIRQGFEESNLECDCVCFPVADGGDGTGELIIRKCSGEVVETEVHDPLGRIIKAGYGLIDNGNTAIIEMAAASGIHLLEKEELNPLAASCFGTGEQIISALESGVKKIIIPMGGTATVDGGCGILKALGVRFLDNNKEDLTNNLPASLIRLQSIDISTMNTIILGCEVVVLCDVNTLLLGEAGAAAMFGPQKGASAKDVQLLDAALYQFSNVVFKQTGKDIASINYGGTAGGAAAGVYGLLNAQLVNGIDFFLDLTHFNEALMQADLVITGEGAIDEQTLQGKGPFGVASKAKGRSIPVIALAGSIPLQPSPALQHYFTQLFSINTTDVDLKTAISTTAVNLTRTAKEVGNRLALTRVQFKSK